MLTHQNQNKKRNPFQVSSKQHIKTNPFDHLRETPKTPKKLVKHNSFMNLLLSRQNDLGATERAQDYAIELNSNAIKRQKLETPVLECESENDSESELDNDKENVLSKLIRSHH